MPLSMDEREQAKENRFYLDLLEMTLTRRGDKSDVYRGPGFIRQTPDGSIEFRLYDRERAPSLVIGSFTAGVVVSDEQYYDLEARDLRGRSWHASLILPHEDSVADANGCICKGTLWQIVCTEERSGKEGLWLYLPGDFKLPTTAGTRVITQTPDEESYSFDLNLWAIEDDHFKLLFTKVNDGLELNAALAEGALPEYLDMRLEEALWFTLAVPAKWTLLEELKAGEHNFKIRAPRDSPSHSRIGPPLNPGHGAPAVHLGEMFIRYLNYVLRHPRAVYHPTSVSIYRNLRASALSVDSVTLWLPVSIESLVRREFPELGCQDDDVIAALDAAIEHVARWEGDPALKKRIVKALEGWYGTNPRSALKQLAQKGVITEQQLSAWNAIRHPMAHGQETGQPIEELIRLCDLVQMALLRLLFEVIGYAGPYTDRSAPGWPMAQYTLANVRS
jgi:hypothetical protein